MESTFNKEAYLQSEAYQADRKAFSRLLDSEMIYGPSYATLKAYLGPQKWAEVTRPYGGAYIDFCPTEKVADATTTNKKVVVPSIKWTAEKPKQRAETETGALIMRFMESSQKRDPDPMVLDPVREPKGGSQKTASSVKKETSTKTHTGWKGVAREKDHRKQRVLDGSPHKGGPEKASSHSQDRSDNGRRRSADRKAKG